jgi:hypothetical protein
MQTTLQSGGLGGRQGYRLSWSKKDLDKDLKKIRAGKLIMEIKQNCRMNKTIKFFMVFRFCHKAIHQLRDNPHLKVPQTKKVDLITNETKI